MASFYDFQLSAKVLVYSYFVDDSNYTESISDLTLVTLRLVLIFPNQLFYNVIIAV